jgi:hypothetical protein
LFQEILKSGIPLLTVRYRDTINTEEVIKHYAGDKQVKALTDVEVKDLQEDTIYWRLAEKQTSGRTAAALYTKLSEKNSQLIYINLENPPRAYFHAGDMPTPVELVHKTLLKVFGSNQKFVGTLMSALGGLTLQEVVEVIKIAQVQYGSINAARLAKTRGLVVPSTAGLTLVDTAMPFYLPNPEWTHFIDKERPFFFDAVDHRLRPKGVLLDGDPGTGKTQGAKFIASKWGVPLYRMDATLNSKWHGESESNLAALLNQAAHEEPCVLLLDEAEKIFGMKNETSGNGVKQKLLSLMLWFMQERAERVFMIFTTNDASAIPPELLREGRLDRQFDFKGLNKDDGLKFMKSVCMSFEDAKGMSEDGLQFGIKAQMQKLYADPNNIVVHSTLAQAAMSVIKGQILAAQNQGGTKHEQVV